MIQCNVVACPQVDVDPVLQQMAVVLVPSIWLEAWGMVVVEAMLRGIPVVVSDAGGLPEACLGAGAVLPVNKIQIPVDQATGCPDWKRRSYPRQVRSISGPWCIS
jgi:glycosyltransferase involved in cell wall biosynthesis